MNPFLTLPNQLTLLRVILTPVFLYTYLHPSLELKNVSLFVFFFAMATDWYDGWVARRWGYITKWGTFLDPLADKIFVSASFFALVYVGLIPAFPVWLMVGRDLLITFLRIFFEMRGKHFQTTFFAKTKTFLQFTLLYYIVIFSSVKANSSLSKYSSYSMLEYLLDPAALSIATYAISLLTVWTGIKYLLHNKGILLGLFFDSKTAE